MFAFLQLLLLQCDGKSLKNRNLSKDKGLTCFILNCPDISNPQFYHFSHIIFLFAEKGNEAKKTHIKIMVKELIHAVIFRLFTYFPISLSR